MGDDFGKLVLRLTLGILVLLHGSCQAQGRRRVSHADGRGLGLPAWAAYGSYLGEVLGPIMVILGIFTRTGAFLIFMNMLIAIALFHVPELFSLNKQGGYALELQAMFLFTAFALMFLNPGQYAITRRY